MASTMYMEHFGLRDVPFSITPDPHFLYLSDQHREALAHLLYGVGEAGGFVLLTGEVGTGKTTVCRCLLQQLPEEVDIAFIINPRQDAIELLHSICDELHIDVEEDRSGKRYIDALTRWLLMNHARGRRTVLLIDEAQNLSSDVLEQLRLLTNLETHEQKLLQLILLGQPELRDKLDLPELRQLAQRITARFHLGPLTALDTAAYVNHRLAVAGRLEEVFPTWAMRGIHRTSGGIPRLINVVCDRILLGLYSENRFRPTRAHLKRAVREVRGPTTPQRRQLPWRRIAGVAGLSLLLFSTVFLARVVLPWQELSTALIAMAGFSNSLLTDDAPSATDVLELAGSYDDLVSELLSRHAPEGEAVDCKDGAASGLRCLRMAAPLPGLLQLKRPAVVAISTESGRQYTLLEARAGRRLQLVAPGVQGQVSESDLASVYAGEFTLLSTYPADSLERFPEPGDRGQPIAWLNEALDRFYGTPFSSVQVTSSLQEQTGAISKLAELNPSSFLMTHYPVTEVTDHRERFDRALRERLRRVRQDLALGDELLLDARLVLSLESATRPGVPTLRGES